MKDIIGTIKDKVSLSKLALLTKPNTLSLHVAVLRTTSHAPSTPPNSHHLATLLTLGNSSRATASILIHSLMNRLHRTTDSHVALKSLFTIHHIIKRGPFILKDQLSVFTATGGRNNFKLSNFRDGASVATWMLSAWVRWYACYVETTIYTSKNIIGSVAKKCLDTCLCLYIITEVWGREKQKDLISSFMNFDLIQDFASLVCVIEEICNAPDNLLVENNALLHCIMELLAHDYLSTVNEIFLRVIEFKERVELLSFNDSVELASALDRLTSCKEKLSHLFSTTKPSVDTLWEMVEELNNKIGMVNLKKLGRRDSASESARFGDRVIRTSDSLKFMSGRLRLNMTGV